MSEVMIAIESNQADKLSQATGQLKILSDEFASLIMNQAVQQTMKGTSTQQWQT